MQVITDDVALAQSPIFEEGLMVHIMSQHGEDCSTIVAPIKVRKPHCHIQSSLKSSLIMNE